MRKFIFCSNKSERAREVGGVNVGSKFHLRLPISNARTFKVKEQLERARRPAGRALT